MSWWMIPMLLLAAPALLLALAAWVLHAAFRQVCAAVAPRPEESEWNEAPPGVFSRRSPPVRSGADPLRCAAPFHRPTGMPVRPHQRCDMN